MTLHTLLGSIRNRLTRNQEPAPKRTRKPRQPKAAALEQIPRADIKAIEECLRAMSQSITNHHSRLHELEQIEHRRSEQEKRTKTNGKED